jgi:hypothetical protein
MTLQFLRIANAGELERERVVLRATADVDIGRYVLFSCFAEDKVALSGPIKKAFWFEDKKIKSGDLVVLYSKDGSESEKVTNTGAVSYFYYWESTTPIWTRGSIPVLLLGRTWSFGSPID